MNSFSAMQKAIEFETERQTELIQSGREDEIVQETRLWDENKLCTYSMRKWVASCRSPTLPLLVLNLPPSLMRRGCIIALSCCHVALSSCSILLSLIYPLSSALVPSDELMSR